MSSKPRALVTRRWPAPCEARLAELFDAQLNGDDRPLAAEELAAGLRECDALFVTVTDRLDAQLLAAEPLRARLLANFGVGTEHIDLAAAAQRGLVVTNTPDVLSDCTADLTLALLLMTARRLGQGERELRAGSWSGWRPTHLCGGRVSGKTLGIVGFGRIGQAVARRAAGGFGMRVLFYDPRPPAAEVLRATGAVPCASLEALLAAADFVSLHCPGGPATRQLIDGPRLALMKRDAYLINTARGSCVDEAALIAALRARTIAGAGLDVLQGEPAVSPALLELDNAVLLPHLGSATHETRVAMGRRAIDNALAFFAGQPPGDRVA